jgi:hypothetical protein
VLAALVLGIRDLPNGHRSVGHARDAPVPHLDREVLQDLVLELGDVSNLHERHATVAESGRHVVADEAAGGRDHGRSLEAGHGKGGGLAAAGQPAEHDLPVPFDREYVQLVLVDAHRAQRAGRRRGDSRGKRGGSCGRQPCASEERNGLRRDEHQDTEHGHDDAHAAQRDDADGGPIDPFKASDPRGGGRHPLTNG